MLRLGASLPTSAPAGSSLPNLLLDDYDGGVRAYSMRKLKKGYSGHIARFRSNATNEEVDVAFDDDGVFSLASKVYNASGSTVDGTTVEAWRVANSDFFVYLAKWYDQSSAGVDLTQPTAGSQSTVYTFMWNVSNGKQMTHFSGSTNLIVDSTGLNLGNLSVYNVSENSNLSFATYQWPWGLSTNVSNYFGNLVEGGYSKFYYAAQYSISQAVTAQAEQQIESFHAGTSAAPAMYRNNSAGSGTGTRVDSATTANNDNIGAYDNGATLYGWTGGVQEFIVFDTDTISDRVAITTNINDYYGTY